MIDHEVVLGRTMAKTSIHREENVVRLTYSPRFRENVPNVPTQWNAISWNLDEVNFLVEKKSAMVFSPKNTRASANVIVEQISWSFENSI